MTCRTSACPNPVPAGDVICPACVDEIDSWLQAEMGAELGREPTAGEIAALVGRVHAGRMN